MELTQLKQFKAVAEYGKISDAANALFISQPALSMAIQKLEKELDCKLFVRTKNSIALNDAGRIVLQYVDRVLSDLQNMERSLAEYQAKSISLNISTSSPFCYRHLVPQYLQSHPDSHIISNHALQEDLKDLLLSRRADLVFSTGPIHDDNIHNFFLYRNRLFISVPENHPLCEKKVVSLKDLKGETILRLEPCGDLGNQLKEIIRKRKCDIKEYYVYDPIIYNKQVETTPYLVFISSFQMMERREYPGRKNIRVQDDSFSLDIYLSYRADNEERIQPFKNWLIHNYSRLFA